MNHSRQYNCWSLICSWNSACRCCSNYIFILHLTPGFNGSGKDNCKMRQKTFKFGDLVWLILKVWWYISWHSSSWCHKSGPILTQVMACCLTAPSHYLNQSWFLNGEVLCFSPGAISQWVPKLLLCIISLKIIHLKLLAYLPGANELTRSISWLLMIASPGHQQPQYSLWRMNQSLSSIMKVWTTYTISHWQRPIGISNVKFINEN